MIFSDDSFDHVHDQVALRLRYLVDLLEMLAEGKDGFLARDWIGPDQGMHGFKVLVDIMRRTSGPSI